MRESAALAGATPVAAAPVTATAVAATAAGPYAVPQELVSLLARRAVAGPRAGSFLSHTPMTGAELARLPLSTQADVEAAVAQARVAQRGWARWSIERRARVFLRLHDLVLHRQV